MKLNGVEIPDERLAAFCRKNQIRELSLFGSALREDFRPDSDIDLLVVFEPDARIGLLAFARIQRELSELVGRRVDLVPKDGLKLHIRQSVIDSAKVVYAA